MITERGTAPSTASVDRGAWKLYVGAALVAAMSLVLAVLGAWGGMCLGLALAAWIAAHPYMRRTWYCIGYGAGYVDGYSDATTDGLRR